MVFVAAALQVAWTRMAALLDAAGLDPADAGQCPACGSPPVAGMVAPGGTKFGHRHLHCSLCATSWRYVRTRCVHCGSTDKISFRQFAGTSYLRAECCEACKGYSKVFYIESARTLEPLADDLASLGLDVLVGEEASPVSPIRLSWESWPSPTETIDTNVRPSGNARYVQDGYKTARRTGGVPGVAELGSRSLCVEMAPVRSDAGKGAGQDGRRGSPGRQGSKNWGFT